MDGLGIKIKKNIMKKTMHYSRNGYEGSYTYTAACGKKVKSHQESEDTSIHPDETDCKECKKSHAYKQDIKALLETDAGMKRRIYIESDILHSDEFTSAQRATLFIIEDKKEKCVPRVFNQVLDMAWHDLDKTWKAVKSADEIYTTSSLMPLTGNSYTGTPVIFNGMCERALKEGVVGKSVIILNNISNIYWDMINLEVMKKAFNKNDLYMYNSDYEIVKIDIGGIKFKKG